MIRLALAFVCTATTAAADGFAIHDLTMATSALSDLGNGFIEKVEPDRITYACLDCSDHPAIDVLLGQAPDDTEVRLRSGETTIADLQALCQAKAPECTIEELFVEPAIGYISTYKIGATIGHTLVIMRDGDMLTIRSLSADADIARLNATLLNFSLISSIVGE
jgi:hypothetical protein